jgi:hypothetical protein
MPDTRRHRGEHPEDAELFAPCLHDALRRATADLSWLRDRGYAADASLKLVGDHYRLHARQRSAVERCSCGDEAARARRARRVRPDECRGRRLLVDGLNQLITIESALAGGIVLRGRDGTLRDLASIHGTYRTVEETGAAIRLLGGAIAPLHAAAVVIFLDAPVSNSGRLRTLILDESSRSHWAWKVDLVNNPDRALIEAGAIAASSDSWVIDRAAAWLNLADLLIPARVPGARIVDLSELRKPGV